MDPSVTPNLDLDLRVAGTGAGVFWLEPEFSPGSGSYFSVLKYFVFTGPKYGYEPMAMAI